MLLIMGGQLGYLYIVGPISMDDGRPMTLPEIPFLGLLVIILIIAGSLIIAAILQKMPAPIRYLSINNRPYAREIRDETDDSESSLYRPNYPGQFSRKTGKVHYDKADLEGNLDWKGDESIPKELELKLGSFEKRELQLPKSGLLFFGFLMSLALGIVALGERGPFIYLFPVAFIVAFSFPGLIWVSYIYSRTITSPEPQRLVLIALAWGMFSTLPASLLNDIGARIIDVGCGWPWPHHPRDLSSNRIRISRCPMGGFDFIIHRRFPSTLNIVLQPGPDGRVPSRRWKGNEPAGRILLSR